jgi:hypothetical protein
MLSTFQTADTTFAAAILALGIPVKYSCVKHVSATSAAHNVTHQTWHCGEEAHGLHLSLQDGTLATSSPAHPIFAALAAIENYKLLLSPPCVRLSLVPLNPTAFPTGLQPACVIRPSAQNDGNLNRPIADAATVQPHYAALLATAGIPLIISSGTGIPCAFADSTYPGLNTMHILQAAMDAEDQLTTPVAPEDNRQSISSLLPGFTPGEHPLHYAIAALIYYRLLTGPGANRARTTFLTADFMALIPTSADKETQILTEKFLTTGGSVFAQ